MYILFDEASQRHKNQRSVDLLIFNITLSQY